MRAAFSESTISRGAPSDRPGHETGRACVGPTSPPRTDLGAYLTNSSHSSARRRCSPWRSHAGRPCRSLRVESALHEAQALHSCATRSGHGAWSRLSWGWGSSELLRANQNSSGLIRSHQGSSELISGHHLGAVQAPELIRSHQGSSELISGHHLGAVQAPELKLDSLSLERLDEQEGDHVVELGPQSRVGRWQRLELRPTRTHLMREAIRLMREAIGSHQAQSTTISACERSPRRLAPCSSRAR